MTALSTHDTKRGEDVRARITVLAEGPATGRRRSASCSRLVPLPDPGFGYLLWQAVVGAWPRPPRPDCASGCTATPRRRCARRATARRGPSPTRRTRRSCTPRSTRLFDRPEVRAVVERGPRHASPSRLEQLARRQAARDHDAGRARRLPGQRALGALASWTPTTAARSTSTTPPLLGAVADGERPSLDRRGRRPRRGQAARHRAALHAAARAGPSCSTLRRPWPPPARPPSTWSPSTAAGRSPSRPASRWGSPPAAAGAGPRSTCRRARGPTCPGPIHRRPARWRPAGRPPRRPAGPQRRDAGRGAWTASTSGRRARSGRGSPVGDKRVDDGPRRRRLVDARRARCRARRGRLRLPPRRRPDSRCPTRARAASPTACTGCRAPSTRRRYAWTDTAWTGRQLRRRRSSTSCTSAPSRPRAPSTRRWAGSTTSLDSASTSSS